eukprot:341941-Rhodomonas_salina.5
MPQNESSFHGTGLCAWFSVLALHRVSIADTNSIADKRDPNGTPPRVEGSRVRIEKVQGIEFRVSVRGLGCGYQLMN